MTNKNQKTNTKKDTDTERDDDQSPEKRVAYMYRFCEIECEMKQLYKEQFNIDPNTENSWGIFTEEEIIERHSQNIAFWQKLKAEYNDLDEMVKVRDPRFLYIAEQHDKMRMSSYCKFRCRPLVIEQIKTRVIELMSSPIPKAVKEECSICLAPMFKYDQSPLECGHMFHEECLSGWIQKDNPTGTIEYRTPSKRQVICFKPGYNIFSCPCCRVVHTKVLLNEELKKKVLATVHMKQRHGKVVHYITHYRDITVFVPKSQVTNERKPNNKWSTILNSLKQQWEKGHIDIYALMELDLDPNPLFHGQFVLKIHDTSIRHMDSDTGVVIGLREGHPVAFRHIDVDELDTILNDC